MTEDLENKFSKKEKSIEEARHRREVNKKILSRYPSILQITSISFKETESHIRQARPTIRCVHDIRISDLVRKVINEDWKLKSPRIVVMIMSNVGSVHDWTNQKQIKSFQKGLMKAAENTNMWLITNGIDMGATTIIGNAVSDYIAEAKYKRLTHRDKPFSKFNFIGIADEDLIKYLPTIAANDELKVEIEAKGRGGDKYGLNQNLSHYILVKDKSEDKNGVNKFLDNLTQYLSYKQEDVLGSPDEKSLSVTSIDRDEIPFVSIIIKGGYGCAHLVLRQIQNQIPVVVLKGSGGLADLLAFAELEIRDRGLTEWDEEFVDTHLKPELTIQILNLFPEYRNNDPKLLDTFLQRILESVRESRRSDGKVYLTVINMNDTYTCELENLTEFLLSALFKTQQKENTEVMSQEGLEFPTKIRAETITRDLNLCVDWNCPEVAKKEVLTKDSSFDLNKVKRLFEEALTRKNRTDFIDLFLSQKFRLRSFVSPTRLKRLFRKIHFNEFFSIVCWEGILGRSFDIRQSDKFIDRELNWLVEACTGNSNFFDEQELSYFVTEQYPQTEREAERKSVEMIVLWGIFHFRKSLVRILWRHSDRPINLALIIALSYDRLSWYVTEQSLSDDLKEESKQFVQFALSVLDKCYRESALRSEKVLNEAPRDWNYKTAVDLAAFGRFREFFSHPSCQRWLTNKFYGNIGVKDLRRNFFRLPTLAKILMSAYLVFPIYWWIRITNIPKNHEEEEEEVEEEDWEEEQIRKSKETVKPPIKVDNKTDSKSNTSLDIIQKKSDEKLMEKNSQKPELIRDPMSLTTNEVVAPKKSPVQYRPHIWKIVYELWTAPITKFWNFQFFYTFYLSIFSIALLYPRCGNLYLDSVISIWTALLLLDDFKQTYILRSTNSNVSIPFRSFEIIFKLLFLLVFIITRLFKVAIISPYQQKVIMSLALLQAFYVLLSKFLPISATLGPLLYRLKIMLLVDFLNFIRLSILVMISFGVVIQAVLYPDLSMDNEVFRKAFHRAFISLFRVQTEDLKEDSRTECTGSLSTTATTTDLMDTCYASTYTDETCRMNGPWPYIFMITYFILLKLILMTLLFALFASSASTLTADTDAIWKYQRYGLVMDFTSRGPLPPPLNIFYYVYLFCKWVKSLCASESTQKPKFRFSDFTLFILYSKSQPQTQYLADDEYIYFKLLASETFDELQKQKTLEISTLQWERIQALSEESELQRQALRHLKGKISEMDRYLKNKFNETKEK